MHVFFFPTPPFLPCEGRQPTSKMFSLLPCSLVVMVQAFICLGWESSTFKHARKLFKYEQGINNIVLYIDRVRYFSYLTNSTLQSATTNMATFIILRHPCCIFRRAFLINSIIVHNSYLCFIQRYFIRVLIVKSPQTEAFNLHYPSLKKSCFSKSVELQKN